MANLEHDNAVAWPSLGSVPTSSEETRSLLATALSVLLLGILAGIILGNAIWFRILEVMPRVPSLAIGIVLICIGARLILQGLAGFRRSGTHVLPYKPALALVTGGIFARTRNPMYEGTGIVVLGVAFLLRIDGMIVLPLLVAPVIHFGLVLPEERYLERRFATDYVRFKNQVPRYGWLFWPSAAAKPLVTDWLVWTVAAAGFIVAGYVAVWLTDLGLELVEEPGVRTAALARASVIGRASLLVAARTAGLHPSPDVKIIPDRLSRSDDGRVSIRGWAAEIGGDDSPLTILVFVDGALALQTRTRGERIDVARILKLSAEAAKNVAFEGTLACRQRQRLVIVAVTVGNKYASVATSICP
jgi:protein-S-isoprenylcysteine O-methyltransferase Ste14